jgi:hypothetical protein
MKQDFTNEKWKKVKIDVEISTDFRIEISNLGRVRSFSKLGNGTILKGGDSNGYKVIHMKLYRPKTEAEVKKFTSMTRQIVKLEKTITQLEEEKAGKLLIKQEKASLAALKADLKVKLSDNLNSRAFNYHKIVHRLVAQYFLPKPKADQKYVGHLDFDKSNNAASNLIWMSQKESTAHQKNSPSVIKAKANRFNKRYTNSKAMKLTVPKVMQLKKLLNENKPMPKLVQQFNVSHTQILRIKRGINWADVPAGK